MDNIPLKRVWTQMWYGVARKIYCEDRFYKIGLKNLIRLTGFTNGVLWIKIRVIY